MPDGEHSPTLTTVSASRAGRLPEGMLGELLALSWFLTAQWMFLYLGTEIDTWLTRLGTVGRWFVSADPDTAFFVLLLAFAPLCWLMPCAPLRAGSEEKSETAAGPRQSTAARSSPSRWQRIGIHTGAIVCIAAFSFSLSVRASQLPIEIGPQNSEVARFGELTPVFHDEFSYLLQSQTLLQGKWWIAGPPQAPELFHQVHVLNEGRFASRYLPGTALWLAPWVALHHPVVGQWVAGMLISIGMYGIGYEVGGLLAGLIAGTLTAVAPGMAFFGNLLLAHHPALLALTVFVFAFVKIVRSPQASAGWSWLAGAGLSFAMLCRPLTAAAVGLPFGIWLLFALLRTTWRGDGPLRTWGKQILGLGGPLLCAFGLIGWQNLAVNGNLFVTPYQRYQELYTPHHRFGFQNVEQTESKYPKKVLKEYDDWAKNLTPALAVENLYKRWKGSFQWTLGLGPLILAALLAVLTVPWQSTPFRLILAAVACLHLAHLPYWLTGILKHHYVFEAGPLLLVLTGVLASQLIAFSLRRGTWLFPIWLIALLWSSVVVNQFGTPWQASRLQQELPQQVSTSESYRRLQHAMEGTINLPALVLVDAGVDIHAEFIRNAPDWQRPLLIGRDRPDLYSEKDLARLFPDRNLYRYSVASGRIQQLNRSEARTGNSPRDGD